MTAYKLDELARAADVAPRTVRYYVQRGLLPPPEFHGKDTAYGADHLLRLRAIKRLQEARLSLDEIQARLASASRAELERLLSSTSAVISPAPLPRSPSRSPSTPRPQRWERWELAPGVELHVSADAGPEAQRLAQSIRTQYGPFPHDEE